MTYTNSKPLTQTQTSLITLKSVKSPGNEVAQYWTQFHLQGKLCLKTNTIQMLNATQINNITIVYLGTRTFIQQPFPYLSLTAKNSSRTLYVPIFLITQGEFIQLQKAFSNLCMSLKP